MALVALVALVTIGDGAPPQALVLPEPLPGLTTLLWDGLIDEPPVVARGSRVLGVVALSDPPREDALEATRRLRALDLDLREYLTDRLEGALEAGDPSVGTEVVSGWP